MVAAKDLTKTNEMIEIEKSQAAFDEIEITQDTLDHMNPSNVIRALIIMKEDVGNLTEQLTLVVPALKSALERLRLVEMSVDLIMRSDPQMLQRILAALPPGAQAEAKAMFEQAGVEMPGAPVATASHEDRPGVYL